MIPCEFGHTCEVESTESVVGQEGKGEGLPTPDERRKISKGEKPLFLAHRGGGWKGGRDNKATGGDGSNGMYTASRLWKLTNDWGGGRRGEMSKKGRSILNGALPSKKIIIKKVDQKGEC